MQIAVGFAVYPIRLTTHRPLDDAGRRCAAIAAFDTGEILIWAGLAEQTPQRLALVLYHEIEEIFEHHFPPPRPTRRRCRERRRDWEAQVHLTASAQIDAQGGIEALQAMQPVDHPLAPPEAEGGLRSA